MVQDWGGPIGLRWAVEHGDRVDRLAILNTGIFTGRVSRGFLAWRDFAEKKASSPGAKEMRAVADALSRWEKPALVAFSDSDPVFPHPKAGRVFCDRIPGARPQVTIAGAAHFLQEDRGEQIAEEVLSFLAAP